MVVIAGNRFIGYNVSLDKFYNSYWKELILTGGLEKAGAEEQQRRLWNIC